MGKSIDMIRDAIKSRHLKLRDFANMVGKTEAALGVQLKKNSDKEIPFTTFEEYANILGYEVTLVDKKTRQPIDCDKNKDIPVLSITIKFNDKEQIVEF